MCGIAGLVGQEASREHLAQMLGAIVHRGPDDSGMHVENGGAVGMRRLSIIDPDGGQQPMFGRDKQLAIVFNGEIYNYLELSRTLRQRGLTLETKSDTEIILRQFEADGQECLRHLRGMFAFAVWDSSARRLFLARDRLGKKPLYYGWIGNTFAFASELKSLVRLPEVDLTLDPRAVEQYFTYRYVPGPRTIFRSFRKLLPGTSLTLEDGRVSTNRYWHPDFSERSRLSLDEAEEEFARVLDEAVAIRLRSDVPVAAFLSGGLDSSTIVGLMARHATRPVRTFTVGWQERADIDELAAARMVADHFSTEHHEVVVEPRLPELVSRVAWHLDEPLADPAAIPTLVMSEVAGREVKVVLTGEGGDELFGGYPYLRSLKWLSQLPPRPAAVRDLARLAAEHLPRHGPGRRLGRAAELLGSDLSGALRQTLSVFRDRERRRLFSPFLQSDVRAAYARPAEDYSVDGDALPPSRTMNDLLMELTRSWLPDELLMKVDKMTMAASIEARAPFLDHCLFEFVGGLPANYKMNGSSSKLLLRRAARRWLPPGVVDRRKQGFLVPLSEWLRGDLRPLVQETLSQERLEHHGLLDPAEVRRLISLHEGGVDNSLQLWTVLCFQWWYDQLARHPGTAANRPDCLLPAS